MLYSMAIFGHQSLFSVTVLTAVGRTHVYYVRRPRQATMFLAVSRYVHAGAVNTSTKLKVYTVVHKNDSKETLWMHNYRACKMHGS
jgi:hypothetical protein